MAEVDFVYDELANPKPDKLSSHPELAAQVSDFETLVRHILSGDAEEKSDIKGLINVNAGFDGALNAVEGGDRTVPMQVLTLYHQSKQEAREQIAAWVTAKETRLIALNQALQEAGLARVSISEIQKDVQVLRAR